jgi:chromate reductase
MTPDRERQLREAGLDRTIEASFPASDPPSTDPNPIVDPGAARAPYAASKEDGAMTTYKVGYFVGSLATASLNRKLARALVRLAPKALTMTEIPFRDLPLYSYDYDADFPAAATQFKEAIAAVDAVLFVTPEYNRSIPGGLKNALDWASRPYGTNSFTRKPAAIIGASPGRIGTAVAQQHLRSILAYCNSPLMNSMEAYIQLEKGAISDDGELANESTRKFAEKFMAEFLAFIDRVYRVLPRPEETRP